MSKENIEVYYPYNETFKYYGEPRAGRIAKEFIEKQNKLKGGQWILHTSEQYGEWYKKIGRYQDYLKGL